MGFLRLAVCISGVYAAFLLWAIAQERLSKPFPSTLPHHASSDKGDKFPSPLFLNYAQALASSLSSLLYLVFSAWRSGTWTSRPLAETLGLRWADFAPASRRPSAALARSRSASAPASGDEKPSKSKTLQVRMSNGHGTVAEDLRRAVPWRKTLPGLLLQVSLCQTVAGPIGFLALRHISYPTMVLGKSCKLIPVMLLNVLLYRRRFSAHKYLVVALVTIGISLFMLQAPAKKKGGSDSAWGLTLLLINLLIDGVTNSTQDQIFASYPQYTGQQMMFTMSLLSQAILVPLLLLPLPRHPLSVLSRLPLPLSPHLISEAPSAPLTLAPPVALECLQFLYSHPTAVPPLLAYALLGGLGQLFIFETIQHFGSLTLVMVTVTRKLFTMLLSVIVFDHRLSVGQWAGVGVVFGGIGVEAGMKRRDMLRRARRD